MQHIGTASHPRFIHAAALTIILAVSGLLPWRVVAQVGASPALPATTQKGATWQEKERTYFASQNAKADAQLVQLDAQIAQNLKYLSPGQQRISRAEIALRIDETAKSQQHVEMLEQHRADYIAAHPSRLSDAQIAAVQKVNWQIREPDRIQEGIRWEQIIKQKLQAHLAAAHTVPSQRGWQRQIATIDQRRHEAEQHIRDLGPGIARLKAKLAEIPTDQRTIAEKLRSYDSEISAYRNISLMEKQARISVLRQLLVLGGKSPTRRQSRGAATQAAPALSYASTVPSYVIAQSRGGDAETTQVNPSVPALVQISPVMAEALEQEIDRLEKQQADQVKRQQRSSALTASPKGAAGEWSVITFLKARRAGAAWAQASIASPEFGPSVKGQKLADLRRFEQEAQQDKPIAEKYVFLLAVKLWARENLRRIPLQQDQPFRHMKKNMSGYAPTVPSGFTYTLYYFSKPGHRVRIFTQDATGQHLMTDKVSEGKPIVSPPVRVKDGEKIDYLVYDNGKRVKDGRF